MDAQQFITEAVRQCYWEKDINCARTTLHTLAGLASFTLEPQIWAAATGMHGAGRFGAQCGLVEGTLMFMGIQGVRAGLRDQRIAALCHAYATAFVQRFGSRNAASSAREDAAKKIRPTPARISHKKACALPWSFLLRRRICALRLRRFPHSPRSADHSPYHHAQIRHHH